MSINKVLYNIDQRAETTDAEKKIARDNIGALGLYEIQPSSTAHTVDQTESQNGRFVFSVGATQPGLYLLSIQLYVSPDGTHPNENVIPLWIDVTRHHGGATNSVVGYTTSLTRLDSNGPWQCRLDILQIDTDSAITSMDFAVNFEDLKIPQGTPVNCRVTGVLIGNIDPTP